MHNQKPPIVIAGNGPSLAQIDYTRLPQNFDVFRCNQFYFEDRYFLGKKIKGVFFNHRIIRDMFFTYYQLQERKEYEIENLYCPLQPFSIDDQSLKYFQRLKSEYPTVLDFCSYLTQDKEIYECILYHYLYFQKFLHMGIYMLVVAYNLGYREFFLTGIDFYEGQTQYAFNSKKNNLIQRVPGFSKMEDQKNYSCHSMEFDKKILEIIKRKANVFFLSENELVAPLAPKIENKVPFEVQSKDENYISDLCLAPSFSSQKQKRIFDFLQRSIKKIKKF
ncbi:alpha-2,3-sialyltransferase [Helicobacter kayseriensis]|uniref:alpha-2,3-sialyltransferase n=1 Tax=Helicobacter kayseriensis TaxID=2905877 RepID=UPI001E601ADA|nr:alpha-2,3-sialyltransferase [Helicobacter kayseriensis]MCE3047138.1 alpha-2,3 sialyltransferase [Helicobacter kayseriensis]MCE3048509.1 alpha-2,3 sialyltransferase [Helicobacter kayseriensis]